MVRQAVAPACVTPVNVIPMTAPCSPASAMAESTSFQLLRTSLVDVSDVSHPDGGRGPRESGCAERTQLSFAYRGSYLRHIEGSDVVADASQVLFFNAGEPYTLSHSRAGAASLIVTVDETLLREIAPADMLQPDDPLRFREHRLRIDPRAQVLVALLRHSLHAGTADALEAESLALTLVQRAIGPRTTHVASGSQSRRRLVDRAKSVLVRDLARRWTLADVAAEVGVSAVYLTQSFREVEGVPLYRYQLRLRLARALDLITRYEDLGALGHDLGFSSHSHFGSAFQQAYGRTPSEFRAFVLQSRQRPRST
jgi:AraC-like DNA-binding protein